MYPFLRHGTCNFIIAFILLDLNFMIETCKQFRLGYILENVSAPGLPVD
jgi:hypothetical protein